MQKVKHLPSTPSMGQCHNGMAPNIIFHEIWLYPILYGWQKKSCYINYGHTKGTPYKINFSHFLPRLRNQSIISEEINNSS